LYLFIWKFPIQVMYPFLHWVVDSFGSWVFFWASWMLFSYQINNWQRFSPILWAAF
jgi:hypothetical protein